MSIRLDPRRVSTLKQLAADAGTRPGDLVRQWVEERIDAARGGAPSGGTPGPNLAAEIEGLSQRVAALEAAAGSRLPAAPSAAEPDTDGDPAAASAAPRRRNAVSAAPAIERVALHDEMIEVLRERGPMTAGELAGAIAERGRYAPPRSGKPLDAAMVSQRVSNPTYRSRFVRSDGRIGLAE
jgi:hypothetical protein